MRSASDAAASARPSAMPCLPSPDAVRRASRRRIVPAGLLAACLATLLATLGLPARAEALFPESIVVTERDARHELALTGQDERVFLVFSVYDIAHYLEAGRAIPGGSGGTIIEDGPAKAIAIRFSRKLGQDRVRKELRKTIRINAEPEWLDEAEPTVERFLRAIDRGARAGDQLVYYWLEGGQVYAEFNGERFFSATDATFAKLIWSIWFGDQPVCDRDKLLARLAPPADP